MRKPGRSSRRFRCIPAILLILATVVSANAQSRMASDSPYLRAQRLIAQGKGDAGRALIDSLMKGSAPGTREYAEGLFWRASSAKRAEDAERDYLRIVIEYPLSPRAEESLIRLAEMEMLHGDRTSAQRHLQRLIVEHPSGAWRAKASYWLARLFFEANEMTRGCHELNIARTRAAPGDVELRNQLDYQGQRCVGVAIVAATPPRDQQPSAPGQQPPASSQQLPASSQQLPASSQQLPASGRQLPAQAHQPPATAQLPPATQTAVSSRSPQTRDSTSPLPARTGDSVSSRAAPTRDSGSSRPAVTGGSAATGATGQTRGSTPVGPVSQAGSPRPATGRMPGDSAQVPSGAARSPQSERTNTATRAFTVQVAAFPTKDEAHTFMESLRVRGYDVRVWGSESPYRVRIGRYATRAEASTMAAELRARMISRDAWVTEAEVR